MQDGQTCECRTFRIIVVSFGIAEERHHAVAEILREVAAIAGDGFCSGALVARYNFAPFFRIEPSGDLG